MSLPESADVVIVGGGVIGASTAYHLAKRGAGRVVLLERNEYFGAESTAKCAGGVRAHFDTEINCLFSKISLPLFERFEAETGYTADYRKIGYLFVLTREPDVAAFRRQTDMHLRLGIRTEWLDGDEVRRRLAMMAFPDALAGLFGPDDGLADNGSVVQGYVAAASRLGAKSMTGVEVVGLKVESGRMAGVTTSQGTIATRTVVNAAGAWAGLVGRMAGLDVPVQPVRRQLFTTTSTPEIPSDWMFVVDFARALYFHREGPGLLSGMSRADEPAAFNQTVDEDWELRHLEAAAERLPLLEQVGIARRWAGLYEVTPDHHPILGPSKDLPGFFLNTGYSGHGFMHAPAAGLLLAEEILDGRASTIDITPLRLERFREGDLNREYNVI
jgi:sarcosine oxidase subunit beta